MPPSTIAGNEGVKLHVHIPCDSSLGGGGPSREEGEGGERREREREWGKKISQRKHLLATTGQ